MTQDIEDRTLRKELEIPLSHADVERLAKEAAGISDALTKDRIEFKKIKTEWKDRIDGLQNGLARVLTVIQAGKEARTVDCVERRNFTENKVQFLFDGQVVEERAMTSHERQQEMEVVMGGGVPIDEKAGVVVRPDFKKAAAGDDELTDEEDEFLTATEDDPEFADIHKKPSPPEPVEVYKEEQNDDPK